jgi:hypothetical protein
MLEWGKQNSYTILVVKSFGELERPRIMWENNIKLILRRWIVVRRANGAKIHLNGNSVTQCVR